MVSSLRSAELLGQCRHATIQAEGTLERRVINSHREWRRGDSLQDLAHVACLDQRLRRDFALEDVEREVCLGDVSGVEQRAKEFAIVRTEVGSESGDVGDGSEHGSSARDAVRGQSEHRYRREATVEGRRRHAREVRHSGPSRGHNTSHSRYSGRKEPRNDLPHKIVPSLWFDNNAEEAVRFYVSLFNGSPHKSADSEIVSIARYEKGMQVPGADEMLGKVLTAIFELNGQRFMALDGGPIFKFTEAVSFYVECEDQEEVDYFWERLSAVPEAEQCGWLKDAYGLSWQIVPRQMGELLGSPRKAATRWRP